MEDELAELLKRSELLHLVAVVDFLEVGPQLLAVFEQADLLEVENQEEVEFLALLELDFVLLENGYHLLD